MTSSRKLAQTDARVQVLRLLAKNPHMTQRDLAAKLGVSVGGAHYLLNALISEGLVYFQKAEPNSSVRHAAYLLTQRGISEKVTATAAFLNRKIAEYKALRDEINALMEEVDEAESRDGQRFVEVKTRHP